jgi:hypothetical protein
MGTRLLNSGKFSKSLITEHGKNKKTWVKKRVQKKKTSSQVSILGLEAAAG